jgi:long-chain fatty acid transport protein
MKKSLAIAAFLLLVSIGSNARASGVSKPVLIGPKAIGMAGAFVGVADDPTAIYHNPAGITQLEGHRFELGMDALITDTDYTPPGGVTESAETEFLPVPQFGYVTDIARPISLGLGVFFPHGNGGTFPTASAVAGNPLEGRIYSMEISPTVAFEVFKGLSLGASLRIIRVSSSLKEQLFPLGAGFDTLDDLDVSGWELGAAGSVFYKPCRYFAAGATYRSGVDVGVSGDAVFAAAGRLPVEFDQTLPTMVTAGFSFLPVETLTLALQYGFERNSEIDVLNVSLGGVGTLPLPYNYDDSHTIHVGAEWWAFPTIAVRAGYAKDLNESIPDATMNRVVGDIAAHETSFGLAYKAKWMTVAATWNGRFGSRTIPVAGTTNPSPGDYDAFVHSVSASVGFGI